MLDFIGHGVVRFLGRIIPSGQVAVAFLVIVLVHSDAGVLRDELLCHPGQDVHVLAAAFLLFRQLVRIAERLLQFPDIGDDLVLYVDQLVEGPDEHVLYLVLGEVRRIAVLLELAVALVDSPAVLVVRVPHLGAIPGATGTALYLRREDADATVAGLAGLAPPDFVLHPVERLRIDDSLVVVLDVVLWHLAIILPLLLREEVDRVVLL